MEKRCEASYQVTGFPPLKHKSQVGGHSDHEKTGWDVYHAHELSKKSPKARHPQTLSELRGGKRPYGEGRRGKK